MKDLITRLRRDGWQQVRMKGSHRQFRHPEKPGTVTVAGKPSLEVLAFYLYGKFEKKTQG